MIDITTIFSYLFLLEIEDIEENVSYLYHYNVKLMRL